MPANTKDVKSALLLLDLVKGLDPAALRDVEQIASVTDGHGRNGLPSEEQVPTGEAQAMRGGQATTQINRHAANERQEGSARDYEQFSRRMDEMEKNVGQVAGLVSSLISNIQKTDEGKPSERFEHQEDTTDDVEKAFRKARVAIRKAEDTEDEDEAESAKSLEKAEAALKAAADAVEKAEDDIKSEDDEKRCEKARNSYRDLRKSYKAVKAARVAKAEEEETKRKEEAEKAKAAAAKAEGEKNEDEETRKALEGVAKSQGISVDELMKRLSGSPADPVAEPPAFAKAASTAETLPARIAAAELTPDEESLAESIGNRMVLAKSGAYSQSQVMEAIKAAPVAVRELFSVSQ